MTVSTALQTTSSGSAEYPYACHRQHDSEKECKKRHSDCTRWLGMGSVRSGPEDVRSPGFDRQNGPPRGRC